MATVAVDRSVIIPAGQPHTGIILDQDGAGNVADGILHEGVRAVCLMTPDETEKKALRLIQLAFVARNVGAERLAAFARNGGQPDMESVLPTTNGDARPVAAT